MYKRHKDNYSVTAELTVLTATGNDANPSNILPWKWLKLSSDKSGRLSPHWTEKHWVLIENVIINFFTLQHCSVATCDSPGHSMGCCCHQWWTAPPPVRMSRCYSGNSEHGSTGPLPSARGLWSSPHIWNKLQGNSVGKKNTQKDLRDQTVRVSN